MTYKDMTFCSGDGCVQFSKCFRALTPEVEARAARIGLPISRFSSPKELDCYLVEKTDTDIQHEPNTKN
jgi:hypothetical protein